MGLQVEVVESKLGRFEGQDVKRYLIRRGDEFEVALISYGAGIQSVKIKDKTQKLVSVALGFDSAEGTSTSNHNLSCFTDAIVLKRVHEFRFKSVLRYDGRTCG